MTSKKTELGFLDAMYPKLARKVDQSTRVWRCACFKKLLSHLREMRIESTLILDAMDLAETGVVSGPTASSLLRLHEELYRESVIADEAGSDEQSIRLHELSCMAAGLARALSTGFTTAKDFDSCLYYFEFLFSRVTLASILADEG